ncbi:MAG TPA: peptide MFS transporter [Saprospiraceae bacterium]|nr:peptide MFS transporter [Saprospiraceae bacterium]HNJ17640.1 peptide MFS transporter [Saprospiraceae bacterium]HNJ63709.1 peptide MFS transporter [Saprospiraceae bacterium]HNL29962.1 peptide MFS transporter [Saprospiraceae bacterium]HNL95030.1 peptide MFS transporter [Saprospiraceae bacterium]
MKSGKHPKALPYLFFTEMWERFGYYLMIGIFVLYLTDIDKGGFGMSRATAADIYGTFIAFVYLTPFIGGFLADQKIGYVRAVFIGGTMMGLGYIGLAIHELWSFYVSLALIIIGNGFFKPNISTLLGNLYSEEKYRKHKDDGFNIFYMGINIGAFICNFFAAYLRNTIGWGAAFIAAGIGMFLGLIVFAIGHKYYKHADVEKQHLDSNDGQLMSVFSKIFLPAILAGVVGWLIPGDIFGSDSTDGFIFASIPIIYYYASLYFKATAKEKEPIGALLAIFAVSIMFWAVFKQNGTALTTWAQYYTDRHVEGSSANALDAIKLVETAEFKKDSVALYDQEFRPVKDAAGKPMKGIDYPVYFKNVAPAQLPAEGSSWKLINTELFQSINPFFVVFLTPLLVLFFGYLRKRNAEPGTPGKIGWGLFISACSTLVMVIATYYCHNGAVKGSAWWLIGTYGVVTVGELFLSPMGLSLVSKLSPPRITALMMGGWMLAISIGNKLSGVLATMWDKYEVKANFFWVNFVLLMIAVVILLSMMKRLNRIFNQYSGG